MATAEQVAAGTWAPEAHYGTIGDGMVAIAPLGPTVSDDTAALIVTRQGEIVNGTFLVFPDPIVDQAGNERELGDIFSMDYFVEGVVGSPTG